MQVESIQRPLVFFDPNSGKLELSLRNTHLIVTVPSVHIEDEQYNMLEKLDAKIQAEYNELFNMFVSVLKTKMYETVEKYKAELLK